MYALHQRPVKGLSGPVAVVEEYEIRGACVGRCHVLRGPDFERFPDGRRRRLAKSRDVRLVLVAVELGHLDGALLQEVCDHCRVFVHEDPHGRNVR